MHPKKGRRDKLPKHKKVRGYFQLGSRDSERIVEPVFPMGFHSVLKTRWPHLTRFVVPHILQIRMKAMVAENFLVVIKTRLKDLFIRAKKWKQPKCPWTAKWINKRCSLTKKSSQGQRHKGSSYCYLQHRDEPQKHVLKTARHLGHTDDVIYMTFQKMTRQSDGSEWPGPVGRGQAQGNFLCW